MSCHVLIVGLPSPAGCASNATWRAAAELVHERLRARFGGAVAFEYAELFGPDMAAHQDIEAAIAGGAAMPPVVVIDGVRRFNGGKLNVSAIERAVAQSLAADGGVASDARSTAPASRTQEEAVP
ncbi:MAG: hypothetical protein M0Z49_02800 [Chloroflexi bacterium]|nr:hypothetical protein [Chloroflexota bacterium]